MRGERGGCGESSPFSGVGAGRGDVQVHLFSETCSGWGRGCNKPFPELRKGRLSRKPLPGMGLDIPLKASLWSGTKEMRLGIHHFFPPVGGLVYYDPLPLSRGHLSRTCLFPL